MSGDLESGNHDAGTMAFTPHSLSWVDIRLKIVSSRGSKQILRGCSGEVLSGEMIALIGPSGNRIGKSQ